MEEGMHARVWRWDGVLRWGLGKGWVWGDVMEGVNSMGVLLFVDAVNCEL